MAKYSDTITQNWKVETFRFTAFPNEIIKNIDQQWWFNISNENPETRTQNPRKGILREEGNLANGKLIIDVQPIRLDCLHTIYDREPTEGEEIPNIGLFSNIIENFDTLINKLISIVSFPILKRIALGATLIQHVSNKKEGYLKLSKYLPFDVDAEGSSDFFYQINRPRLLELSGSKFNINRLSKWSVVTLEMLAFQIKPDLQAFSPSETKHAIRLELDINTSQHHTEPFKKEILHSVFEELVNYGIEISEKGDIP